MAAFTTFGDEALDRYLVMFGQGRRKSHAAIAGGIENSNYLVTLERDGVTTEHVLTILEGLSFQDAPFFGKLLTHLYRQGLPVAAPRETLDGMTSTIFCGKPTFLFPRLPGHHLESPDGTHCRAIGEFLGDTHRALSELRVSRANPYDMQWMGETLDWLKGKLPPEQLRRLKFHAGLARELATQELPRGLIHGDLFRDNALFQEGKLTGVIDFYHACEDALLQDIAITVNDWCAPGNRVDDSLRAALLDGYGAKRELEAREVELLPAMQRAAALRFALTRYLSGDPPLKDPAAMLDLADSLARDG